MTADIQVGDLVRAELMLPITGQYFASSGSLGPSITQFSNTSIFLFVVVSKAHVSKSHNDTKLAAGYETWFECYRINDEGDTRHWIYYECELEKI